MTKGIQNVNQIVEQIVMHIILQIAKQIVMQIDPNLNISRINMSICLQHVGPIYHVNRVICIDIVYVIVSDFTCVCTGVRGGEKSQADRTFYQTMSR